MSNILITGSKGQLGLEFVNLERNFSNYNFFFTDKFVLNITNFDEVETFILNNKIAIVINCAALTNVDKAEDKAGLANEINHLAVKNLAEIAKNNSVKLIHISTDYVFDGASNRSYVEEDITNPQNIYGISKLNGEKAVKEINPDNSIIIRTSWLYSKFDKNFVKTIQKLSKDKDTISVVSDQIGSPTHALDLAQAILQIIPFLKSKGVQVYHYANKGECSWFQFAEEIVKLSKNKCDVVPVSSIEFKSKASRPNFSLLNTDKIQQVFNLTIPHWKNALEKYFSEEEKV